MSRKERLTIHMVKRRSSPVLTKIHLRAIRLPVRGVSLERLREGQRRRWRTYFLHSLEVGDLGAGAWAVRLLVETTSRRLFQFLSWREPKARARR
jgi:hypothetical protein